MNDRHRFYGFLACLIFSEVFLSQAAVAQPVQVISEHKLTSSEVVSMTDRLGIDILDGYNNLYSCQGFQYQINFLKCTPSNVSELAEILQQIAPKSTLARTIDGVYEIITADQILARNVLLSLDGVSILEKGKLIPLQLPIEWLITAETFAESQDILLLNKSSQGSIVEVFNQVIRTGATERVQINYILCADLGSAERVFGVKFASAKHPRALKRIGRLVIEVIATNPDIVSEIMDYFK